MRRDFPGHTEGDIYMRVWEHRGKVMEETQINVSVDWVTQDLAAQKGVSAEKLLARCFKNIIPDDLSCWPGTGQAGDERIASLEHKKGYLFGYILVSLGRNKDRSQSASTSADYRSKGTLNPLRITRIWPPNRHPNPLLSKN